MRDKKLLLLKVMLAFSGSAFLFLVSSSEKTALFGCIVAAIAWCVFVWNSSASVISPRLMSKPVYLVSGILFCCAIGSNFYNTWLLYNAWVNPGRIQRISEVFHIGSAERFLLTVTVVVIAAAAPVVSIGLSYFMTAATTDLKCAVQADSCREGGQKKIPVKKAFFIVAAIYATGISAILRANFNYNDDMGRVAGGYKEWTPFSRFLSEALSPFIHMDNYLTDVSPMPQLIAVLLLALSGIILLYIVCGRTCFSIGELIALVPLGLNPYFMECISYKYDSPYIALSVLAAVFPLLYKEKDAFTYIAASVIGTVVLCTSYQASSGIYPMLVIVLMLKMWNQKEDFRKIGSFCLRSVTGYGLGLLFFKIMIMIPVDKYVSNSLFGIRELIPGIFHNLGRYYKYVRSDFKMFWLVLIAVLSIGFLWTAVCSSKQKRYLAAVMAVISLLFLGLLCFGMYPALTKPLFDPRAMYGFGVMIAIFAVCTVGWQGKALFQMSAFALCWVFFVFSFTYGNALYAQKEYTDFRIQMVIDDLKDMDVFLGKQDVTVQIAGTIGRSPVLKNMPKNYKMLNRLVPIMFRGEWMWGTCGFYYYYGLKNVVADDSIDLTNYDLPVLEDGMYHTIKGKDYYILIELK